MAPIIVSGPGPSLFTFATPTPQVIWASHKLISDGTYCIQTNGGHIQDRWTFDDMEFTHAVHNGGVEPGPSGPGPPQGDPFYLPWPFGAGEPAIENDLYHNGNPAWNSFENPHWGIRARGVRAWLLKNSHFRWTYDEHGIYWDDVGNGFGTFLPQDGITEVHGCLFDHLAAQACQFIMRRDGLGGVQQGGVWLSPPGIGPPYDGIIYFHDNIVQYCGLWPHGVGRAGFACTFFGSETTAGTAFHEINTGHLDFIAPQIIVFFRNTVIHDHLTGPNLIAPWTSVGQGSPRALLIKDRPAAYVEENMIQYLNQTSGPICRFDNVLQLFVQGNSFVGTGNGGLQITIDNATDVIWNGNSASAGMTVVLRNRAGFVPGGVNYGTGLNIPTGVTFPATASFTIANGVVGAVPNIPTNPIQFQQPPPPPTPPPPGPDAPGGVWVPVIIRSSAELALAPAIESVGGDVNQIMHGIDRCRDAPNTIYLAHDCANVWRSTDGGQIWNKTVGEGWSQHGTKSIACHPTNPNLILAEAWRSFNTTMAGLDGIYRSINGGANWTQVSQHTTHQSTVHYGHTIAYDPTLAGRWYAVTKVIDEGPFDLLRVLISTDDGASWTAAGADIEPGNDAKAFAWSIWVSNITGHLYVATFDGVYRSADNGATWARNAEIGSDTCRSVAISEEGFIYATKGVDVWRSTDSAGTTFAVFKADYETGHVFAVGGDAVTPGVLWLIPHSTNPSNFPTRSVDGGTVWVPATSINPAPGLERNTTPKTDFRSDFACASPHPTDFTDCFFAAGSNLWRTQDGLAIDSSSLMFTGFRARFNGGRVFDPVNANKIWQFNVDTGPLLTTDAYQSCTIVSGLMSTWPPLTTGPGVASKGGAIPNISGGTEAVCVVGADVGALTDKVAYTADDGVTWTRVVLNAGGGEQLFQDNINPVWHQQAPLVGYAGFYYTDDGWATLKVVPWGAFVGDNPYIVDACAADSDVVWAMNDIETKLFRSTDKGLTWALVSTPGWNFKFYAEETVHLAHPTDTTKFFSNMDDGDLGLWDGSTWTNLGVLENVTGLLPGQPAYVLAAAVDPAAPNVIYASCSNQGYSILFRSQDAGGTWVQIDHNRTRAHVDGFSINPHTREVFVGSGCSGSWDLLAPDTTSAPIYNAGYALYIAYYLPPPTPPESSPSFPGSPPPAPPSGSEPLSLEPSTMSPTIPSIIPGRTLREKLDAVGTHGLKSFESGGRLRINLLPGGAQGIWRSNNADPALKPASGYYEGLTEEDPTNGDQYRYAAPGGPIMNTLLAPQEIVGIAAGGVSVYGRPVTKRFGDSGIWIPRGLFTSGAHLVIPMDGFIYNDTAIPITPVFRMDFNGNIFNATVANGGLWDFTNEMVEFRPQNNSRMGIGVLNGVVSANEPMTRFGWPAKFVLEGWANSHDNGDDYQTWTLTCLADVKNGVQTLVNSSTAGSWQYGFRVNRSGLWDGSTRSSLVPPVDFRTQDVNLSLRFTCTEPNPWVQFAPGAVSFGPNPIAPTPLSAGIEIRTVHAWIDANL